MIVGVGNDVLEVSRMRRELARGHGFRDEVFTASEIAYCESRRYPARHFAARFAAKEALLKALRTGADHRWSTWREVEVAHGARGEPELVLHGHVKRLAGRRRVKRVMVSLSHTASVAMASVVLES